MSSISSSHSFGADYDNLNAIGSDWKGGTVKIGKYDSLKFAPLEKIKTKIEKNRFVQTALRSMQKNRELCIYIEIILFFILFFVNCQLMNSLETKNLR